MNATVIVCRGSNPKTNLSLRRIESGWCWKIPTYVVKARSVADVGIRGWAEGREEIVVGGWNKLYVGMGGMGGEAVKR